MDVDFYEGNEVEKRKGYRFPGVVVARFYTTAGKLRYVVECTAPETSGMLHIFNGEQLCDKGKREEEAENEPESRVTASVEGGTVIFSPETTRRALDTTLPFETRALCLLQAFPFHDTLHGVQYWHQQVVKLNSKVEMDKEARDYARAMLNLPPEGQV